MEPVKPKVLERVLAGTAEPLVIVRVDQPDWPVVFANPAFDGVGGAVTGKAFADVIEELGGRELALEVSEVVRSGQETSFAMEVRSREYLLVLKPASIDGTPTHYAAYWRSNAGSVAAHRTAERARFSRSVRTRLGGRRARKEPCVRREFSSRRV